MRSRVQDFDQVDSERRIFFIRPTYFKCFKLGLALVLVFSNIFRKIAPDFYLTLAVRKALT